MIFIGILVFGILFNAENKIIISNFISNNQSIAAAVIGSIIASGIAVAGWIFIYYFNNKIQEKRLKNDITNIARTEITAAIREYERCLIEVESELDTLKYTINPHLKMEEYFKIFHQKKILWNQKLEDYQMLFPEVESVRIELQHRDIELMQMLMEIRKKLFLAVQTKDGINELAESNYINNTISYMLDQIGLMDDLRKYLQNRCLGEITGNSVNKRNPKGITVPQIIINKDSKALEIYNNVTGTAVGRKIQELNQK
jgi:hypothetical protein